MGALQILHLCKLLDNKQGNEDTAVEIPPSLLDDLRGQVTLSQDQGHAIILTVLTALEVCPASCWK